MRILTAVSILALAFASQVAQAQAPLARDRAPQAPAEKAISPEESAARIDAIRQKAEALERSRDEKLKRTTKSICIGCWSLLTGLSSRNEPVGWGCWGRSRWADAGESKLRRINPGDPIDKHLPTGQNSDIVDAGDAMQTLSIVSLFVGVALTTFVLLVGLTDLASPSVGLTIH
jgi:hypothetical protein